MCEGRKRRKEEGQEMSMRVVAVKAPSGLWRRPMTAASAHIHTSAQVYFFLSDAHSVALPCPLFARGELLSLPIQRNL